MTNFGGQDYRFGAPPHDGYGAPHQAPVPRSERFSPGTQVLIGALLLVPTLIQRAIFIGAPSMMGLATDWPPIFRTVWFTSGVAVLGVYFIVVVALWSRSPERRRTAVSIAGITVLIDVVSYVGFALAIGSVYNLNLDLDLVVLLSRIMAVVTVVGYALSWGVARRRGTAWAWGLIPAVIVAALVEWALASLPSDVWSVNFGWLVGWALYVGGFVLSCLICWAIDAMPSGSRRATTPQIPGR
ncbi:hypothetical protein A5792_14430 [Mycolicibacterium peregrinum]|uniref:Uncharacterized protein n=1 Tax=Mycolicibacterium peregrinum TaxID=43304 RepID=A0A1A0RCP0_MYCPR|nr:hypothetical protein [Mycolicibacterium peregrinum]OBB31883.1 hypothetical protein A5792_14430 [Mycolicibacterium peregrinum]